MKLSFLIYIIFNIFVFLVYGYDKLCAKRRMRRVKEINLIILAFALGGIGSIFGMIIFNHKTSKSKFIYLVPLATFLNIIMIYIFFNFSK